MGGDANKSEAGEEEDGHPGPDGVKLPHMAQVAEVGEEDRALAGYAADVAPVEGRGRGTVGAFADEEEGDETSERCQQRGCVEDNAPVADATQAAYQVRGCRTDGERANQEADAQPSVGFGPGSHDLHADRVDARQEEAGEETQDEYRVPGAEYRVGLSWRKLGTGEEGDSDVSERGEQGAGGEEETRREAVSKVKEGRAERAHYKASLNGDGEEGGHDG